jgi:hypothetical protein
MSHTKRGSQLSEIYKQQYLKSVGKDNASIKQKRQEALKCLDEWIESQYSDRQYERLYNSGVSEYNNNMCHHYSRGEEYNKNSPTEEDVGHAYAEKNFGPRIPFSVILSIRDLLD